MATAQRRSAGRSPVPRSPGGAKARANGTGAATPGAAGSTPSSSWLLKAAAAALGLAGCFLVVLWAAPAPGSAGSSSSSPAGSLLSHLKGRKAQDRQQQETAYLNAYCEAPLQGGLEGPAHLPPLPVMAAANGGAASRPPPKLRQLQVVIRHGDRSPINSLTAPPPRFSCKLRDPAMARLARLIKEDGEDPPFNIVGLGGTATRGYLTTALLPQGQQESEETQPCFPGQLTEKGFRQQVANGRFLRERYAEALGPISDPATDLYVRSTNYPRTFQSGAALLLSFLGQADVAADTAEAVRNITVFVQEENGKEPMFGLGLVGASRPRSVDPFEAPANERGPCPLAFHLGARQEAAFEHDPVIDEQFYSELGLSATLGAGSMEGAHKGHGGGPKDLSVVDQTDPLMGMHCHAKKLPVSLGTAARLKSESDRLFCDRFTGEDGGRDGTRLGMQPFLTEVMGRFKQAATGAAPAPKFALYSAHDTVIAPLVAGLDGYDAADGCQGRWPPYASRVVMELWEMDTAAEAGANKDGHVLRFLYNGRVISNRDKHCPGYQAAGDLDSTLLPLECFEQYVDRLDDKAGESCLDVTA